MWYIFCVFRLYEIGFVYGCFDGVIGKIYLDL